MLLILLHFDGKQVLRNYTGKSKGHKPRRETMVKKEMRLN